MKHIKLFEEEKESYTEEDVTNAIRFAIEKFSNYHQAMSRQEAAATFIEWTERGEYYEEDKYEEDK